MVVYILLMLHRSLHLSHLSHDAFWWTRPGNRRGPVNAFIAPIRLNSWRWRKIKITDSQHRILLCIILVVPNFCFFLNRCLHITSKLPLERCPLLLHCPRGLAFKLPTLTISQHMALMRGVQFNNPNVAINWVIGATFKSSVQCVFTGLTPDALHSSLGGCRNFAALVSPGDCIRWSNNWRKKINILESTSSGPSVGTHELYHC